MTWINEILRQAQDKLLGFGPDYGFIGARNIKSLKKWFGHLDRWVFISYICRSRLMGFIKDYTGYFESPPRGGLFDFKGETCACEMLYR